MQHENGSEAGRGGACAGNLLSDSGASFTKRTTVQVCFTAVVRPVKALLLLFVAHLKLWWKNEKRHKQLTSAGVPRAGTIEFHAIPVRLVRRRTPLLRCFGSPSHDPLNRGRQMAEILSALCSQFGEKNQVFTKKKVALEYVPVLQGYGDKNAL